MTLPPLITTDDVTDRLGRPLTESETLRIDALIADASASVRSYTGQEFTRATSTARLKVKQGRIRLPQRPVNDVIDIANTEGNNIGFSWDAGDTIAFGFGVLNAWELEPIVHSSVWMDVTYDHGYDEVPDDIVAVTAQVVGRAIARPVDGTGVQQESIAGYSYSVGAASVAGPLGLLLGERQILDRYMRFLKTTMVSR